MALGYREGWIFGRVIRRRLAQFKPYPLIDSNGNAIDIAENSFATQGGLRLRDPRNTEDDILHLPTATDRGLPWIMHGALGIKPNAVNMYIRMPEAQSIPGKFPNIDPISPSRGDDLGYVNGLKSPYNNPSEWAELVIPPKQHVDFEFFNKDSGDGSWNHQPTLNILFAIYWFQALTTREHHNLIGRIAAREVPAAFFTIGVGDEPLGYDNDIESAWGATTMTLEEATALSPGRGGQTRGRGVRT